MDEVQILFKHIQQIAMDQIDREGVALQPRKESIDLLTLDTT